MVYDFKPLHSHSLYFVQYCMCTCWTYLMAIALKTAHYCDFHKCVSKGQLGNAINMQKRLISPGFNTYTASPSAGVSGSLDSYCSLKPLCSGMGEVVPARTLPTLLPPSPRTVLSLSCFKVLQCINCRDWHFKS